MASFLYTINYTWHLYMDLKVKYSQNLHRMSSLVSAVGWFFMYYILRNRAKTYDTVQDIN